MNGNCDFCPRPGRLATAMCVHEHKIGVWVRDDKHDAYLMGDEISCRICSVDVAPDRRHWCTLSEVPS